MFFKNEKSTLFSSYNQTDKRKKSLALIKDIINKGVFRRIEKTDEKLISECVEEVSFADLTFSILWAWDETYNYCIREFDNVVFIIGIGIYDNIDCFFIKKKHGDIKENIKYIYDEFLSRGYNLGFENISEDKAELIKSSIMSPGITPEISYDRDFSDYIYKRDNFLNLSGNSNRGKRSKYNNFVRNHPDASYVKYTKDKYDDVLKVFNQWCSTHNCKSCIFGCEYNAFIRLLDIYKDNGKIQIGIIYEDDKPLSFAVTEFINSKEVSFYMQKNAQRISGLTYYLELKMLEDMPEAELINMGEDMGLDGLRMDKESYHPDFIRHKFKVNCKNNFWRNNI